MQDKIIARRHNSYRLRAGLVTDVDPGKGPLLQAGIGPATMEKVSVHWDDGDPSTLVRRFPAEVQPGHRMYALFAETGVSVHPDRPVFLFNSGNGHQHREVNAPAVRTRLQVATDRLPILLSAVVAGGFASVYSGWPGATYHEIATALWATVGVLMLMWCAMAVYDVRQNRRRAERLEDELSAAKEAVDVMNADIRATIEARTTERQASETPSEGAGY